jgi:NAD(P)-dependent dehydrogenase (short-subunit alcohol dehydrogenase family)
MANVWFITGATRGIGAAIAKEVLAAGDKVVATGRDVGKMQQAFNAGHDQLLILSLDVTDNAQVENAVEVARKQFGKIDVLVNNAGYGELGVFEAHTPQAATRQFDTNVFGLFNVTRAVLPAMREQSKGRIFNISSVAGIKGGPGATLYAASKFAVEGFSEALAVEVEQFGINVTLIEPGFFRTDFLDGSSMRPAEKQIPDYAKTVAALQQRYETNNHRQIGDPEKLAQVLLALVKHPQPPMRLPVGTDASKILSDKIESLKSEFETWKDWSSRTDGDPAR